MIPKFRAWDKETKTMNGMAEIYRNRNQEIELHPRDENIILMQSTGLKDKNGKEIFEGDVIAIEVDDTETPINARVFQNIKIGVLMFHVFEDNEDVPMVELLEDNSVAFEIIGNIYENPELLEVTE
ncbi:YopX family protein [Streptococcus parasanguinis]|uniref:YopX family protein n=1 Tax=Streptococcus parasanguinis TaxID=1318 RepID=UPI00319DC19D